MNQLGDLLLDVIPGWLDTTEADHPPTLSKPDGYGALQFSVAKYSSGEVPQITENTLHDMLVEFAASRELGEPVNPPAARLGRVTRVGATFDVEGAVLRVWYLSDGRSVVLATYFCHHPEHAAEELRDCEAMLSTLTLA
jgi:hypothetical protein